MKPDPLVTVIVLNWNGRDFLKDCLESLKKVEYEKLNILVVDNGSTDESVKYIESTYPNVDVLELKNNIGYAIEEFKQQFSWSVFIEKLEQLIR